MRLPALLLFAFLPLAAHADTIPVAVAANFMPVMQKLAPGFEKQSGHTLQLSSGATGKFYAQIRAGAPFMVLLAADDTTPLKLEQEGLGITGTRFNYATGQLALWSPLAGAVDKDGAVLKLANFRKLAIASPKAAPYGQAAMETLQALKLDATLAPKLVQGESIAQTYQFVATGNADFGFVALSQIMENGKLRAGSVWIVPATLHHPIRQDAILLKPGVNSAGARALLDYLKTPAARAVMQQYGYRF
ncbi:molybdate ABC transporter substrate-binding protein [Chitinilyticum litopenaei]|uniref:molybdate ABC transporter substrate-binding protein n=1 Tax=Chitinilyticum litopenaei TaxID=1121276 RepID=UPI00041B3B61|nr:molybdate ABC transporter substrate-binding protein [Chitinilyticum litopenaei]